MESALEDSIQRSRVAQMQKLSHQILSFDNFALDLTRGCLLREDEEIKLRPQTFETLKFLVENSGRLINKDELINAVWPDWNASDNQLAKCLSEVRQALGDEAQHYLKTVPRRGYIFDAQITEDASTTSNAFYQEQVESIHVVIDEEAGEHEESGARPPSFPSGFLSHLRGWRLRVLAISALGVVLLGGAAYLLLLSKPKAARPITKRTETIAVLPFKPISQEGKDEYLELGMADALITKLSNLREIVVRPTSAVRKYAGQEQNPVAAGKELKATVVLEGTVQRADDRIRVTVQLVSVEDGNPLWAEKFDEKFGDIFAVQDAISEKIVERLALKLTGEDVQRLTKRYTQNTEAYQLYVKGVFYRDKLTEDSLQKAVQCFQQAVEADPNYALAYAGLSSAYGPMMFFGFLPVKDGRPKMLAAGRKGLELDDTLAEAHTESGVYKFFYERDWSGGENAFKRAIELNPNYWLAHHMYANLLSDKGRFEDAITERKRALEIDPLSVRSNALLGWDYYVAGRYDEALEQYRKASELDPNYPLIDLGHVYECKGMNDAAIAEYLSQEVRSGMPAEKIRVLKDAYAAGGIGAYWQKRLDLAKEKSTESPVRAIEMAKLSARVNDKNQAFLWLEKAYQDDDPVLLELKIQPMYSSLRGDPRFEDLIKRIGL